MPERLIGRAERLRIRRWDGAVAAWVVVCGVLAGWTAVEVASLRSLTDTLETSSGALSTTAEGLRSLAGVPVVGDDIDSIAGRVTETAASARASAVDARRSIGRIAALVGVAIFTMSTIPAVVAYLSVRRSWVTGRGGRERRRDLA
ncbi:MAG TPA: hypothetical protein VLA82_02610 [Actinomycetota bacterium]|nr:hypothetical protein [Actinomycetota bacterium]